MGDEKILLALSTFPDRETARRIAQELVTAHLVACANIVSQIESLYFWKGKLETSEECLAIFKLSAAVYENFQARLRALHPYDVPEIICFPLSDGLPEYLRWVRESCGENAGR
ncbi:MAG: periplasmic divalent cation tolerance protein [Verrucomicrobiota bacterium]|jgi:periplasmic divalent cation tolerance protein